MREEESNLSFWVWLIYYKNPQHPVFQQMAQFLLPEASILTSMFPNNEPICLEDNGLREDRCFPIQNGTLALISCAFWSLSLLEA